MSKNQDNKNNKNKEAIKNNIIKYLLIFLIAISFVNSCHSCRNTSMLKKTQKRVNEHITEASESSDLKTKELIEKFYVNLVDVIEQNSEAQVIIEKEIDRDRDLRPTEVKKMFKQHRDYDKVSK